MDELRRLEISAAREAAVVDGEPFDVTAEAVVAAGSAAGFS